METARYMYNFARVDSVECVVLIAINWFGQSHASSPEMTRIAKIAFCTFCVKTKTTTTTTTTKKQKDSRQNTYKTVPTARSKYLNFFCPLFFSGMCKYFYDEFRWRNIEVWNSIFQFNKNFKVTNYLTDSEMIQFIRKCGVAE